MYSRSPLVVECESPVNWTHTRLFLRAGDSFLSSSFIKYLTKVNTILAWYAMTIKTIIKNIGQFIFIYLRKPAVTVIIFVDSDHNRRHLQKIENTFFKTATPTQSWIPTFNGKAQILTIMLDLDKIGCPLIIARIIICFHPLKPVFSLRNIHIL